MIEVFDVEENQTVMINVNKIVVIYRKKDGNVNIELDGVDFPVTTNASYEEVKRSLKGVVNVR